MTVVFKDRPSLRALTVPAIVLCGCLLLSLKRQQDSAQGEQLPTTSSVLMAPAADQPDKLVNRYQKSHEFDNSDPETGEPVSEPSPGAETIPMLAGPDLLITPADPNKPRAEQVEWNYAPPFSLEEAKYDSANRILLCRIDPRLSQATKNRVYQRLGEITNAPVHAAFRLTPVRLQKLAVELVALDKTYLLRSENSGHNISHGLFPILYRVKDDELHDLLQSNLRDLTLTIRTLHPYASLRRNRLQVESSFSAAREAFEKVFPKWLEPEDLENHPLYVDRDSLLKAQQRIREQFRVLRQGNPDKFAEIDKVLEKAFDRITVSDLPLHEVTTEVVDHLVAWDSKSVRLDVSPSERTTMTKELKEATEKRSAYKHAWDTMRDEAKKDVDDRTWHKTLLDKMKLDTKLKIGIGIFGGSASMKLDEEHSKSDAGAMHKLHEIREQMRNVGEVSNETLDKVYREFRGEDWAKSSAGKILNLKKITNFDLHTFRVALFEHNERLSKGLLEHVTLLPLESSQTRQEDALREIQLLRQEIVKLVANDKQRRVDEVGTMKPWFSTKLPRGWVRADGTATFPNADWVLPHLRGQRVPNMRAQLIGGPREESQVGYVFKDGKIIVDGGNFALQNERTESTGVIKKGGVPVYGLMAINGSNVRHDGDEQRLLMNLVGVGNLPQYDTVKGLEVVSYRYDKKLGGTVEIPLNDVTSVPCHVMCHWIIYIGEDEEQ